LKVRAKEGDHSPYLGNENPKWWLENASNCLCALDRYDDAGAGLPRPPSRFGSLLRLLLVLLLLAEQPAQNFLCRTLDALLRGRLSLLLLALLIGRIVLLTQ